MTSDPTEGDSGMATKLLTKATGQKEGILSQIDGASSSGAELPEAAEESTPEKAKTINVWHQRDVVILAPRSAQVPTGLSVGYPYGS